MGIYDRDYVRREGSGLFGPILERGNICKWLIGITVVVFLAQVLTTPAPGRLGGERVSWITKTFILDADSVLHGQVWRLVTYPFVYSPASIWPILWGMLFLWWFGRDVDDIYGPREFLAFYFASVLLASLAYMAVALAAGASGAHLTAPPYLGAGAPVAAVLVLCACHFPGRIIYIMLILPVPIWLVAVADVALDCYSFLNFVGPGEPMMALAAIPAASLTAAGFAFLYYRQQWRVSTLWPDLQGWKRRLRRPRLRVYHEDEEPRAPVRVPAGPPEDEDQLEARLDAILEKISRTGKDSLTDGERELLLKVSERIRRRRG
jgi:membrane associated rhomboid family serine protease